MWCLPNDDSKPVITASEHSTHRSDKMKLPQTAVVFFMSKGTDYLVEHYETEKVTDSFPRFLNRCPIWNMKDSDVCFLDGGRGAPQAVDTVETLAALGVKNIIAVGMCGAYADGVRGGEIIAPAKVFVEEGTSLHYYESIEVAYPDPGLQIMATTLLGVTDHPIVSTDAVYRQTFAKEALWREKGAVGVDMETSAVLSVAQYLGLKAVALLMVSDIHPLMPGAAKWEWNMTKDMRCHLAEQGIALAKAL